MKHLVAISAALAFAYAVSLTPLTQSSVQFVGPLAVILLVHVIAVPKIAGFAVLVWRDGAVTAVMLALGVLVASLVAPQPAAASDLGEAVSLVLTVLFCVVIIAVVAAVLAAIGWVVIRLLRAVIFAFRGGPRDPDSRLFDVVSLSGGAAVLAAASVEGVLFGFDPVQEVTATRHINAPHAVVWETMQTATSPTRVLPVILRNVPQPVAVLVDEGTDVGANRVVAFAGREGAGQLHLRVTEGARDLAVFRVQSDSTPFPMWIGFDTLAYATAPSAEGTALAVSLRFERRLAPALVFDPLMRGAAWLAADVLARDVQARAEG